MANDHHHISTEHGWIGGRYSLLARWKEDRGRALWAGLELLCAPLSIAALLCLLAKILCERAFGLRLPAGWNAALQVLLTAAIGYGTNFIAIEMLFKPFDPTPRHWLRWLTLGFWKQGLIPKNKNRIAVEIGTQVEEKLLPTDRIVEEVGDRLTGALDDGSAIALLRKLTGGALLRHESGILQFLEGKFLLGMNTLLEERFTSDKLRDLLLAVLLPAVGQEKTKTAVAVKLQEEIARMSPQITEMLKAEAVRMFSGGDSPLAGIPFLNLVVGNLAQSIGTLKWDGVERRVGEAIRSEKTRNLLLERLEAIPELLRDWLASPEGEERLQEWTSTLKEQLRGALLDCYRAYAPRLLRQLYRNDSLWHVLEHDVMPALKPHLRRVLQNQGRQWLGENLHLGARITHAIEEQDVRQFYSMITAVSAQHLGAIQVLGFLLGAIVGLLQLSA